MTSCWSVVIRHHSPGFFLPPPSLLTFFPGSADSSVTSWTSNVCVHWGLYFPIKETDSLNNFIAGHLPSKKWMTLLQNGMMLMYLLIIPLVCRPWLHSVSSRRRGISDLVLYFIEQKWKLHGKCAIPCLYQLKGTLTIMCGSLPCKVQGWPQNSSQADIPRKPVN